MCPSRGRSHRGLREQLDGLFGGGGHGVGHTDLLPPTFMDDLVIPFQAASPVDIVKKVTRGAELLVVVMACFGLQVNFAPGKTGANLKSNPRPKTSEPHLPGPGPGKVLGRFGRFWAGFYSVRIGSGARTGITPATGPARGKGGLPIGGRG